MAAYQTLPQLGRTNVGTISKHLKEFSTRLKALKSSDASSFNASVLDLSSFHSGLKEIIFHSTVPSSQNAKLFAVKSQYNTIIPCYESILSLKESVIVHQNNNEDASATILKLNEKFEEHNNIHKDICALYELFKEYEEEEIRALKKAEDSKKGENSTELQIHVVQKEVKMQPTEKVFEDPQTHSTSAHDTVQKNSEPASNPSKSWVWILLTVFLLLLILTTFLVLN